MRLLIIEPDRGTAQAMELMAKSQGINVYSTDLAEEGVDLAKIYDYDIITLDMHLPDSDGLAVIRDIRKAGVKTPLFVITGDHLVETKVAALAAGADDYMTKPFHKDEMIARIQAIVRRAKGHTANLLTVGDLVMNLDLKHATVAGKRVELTDKEYQMLELLMLNKGSLQTKERFMNHLYGGMDEPEPKIVDVFICKVRKKLKAAGADGLIQTIWGRGYTLSAPSPIPQAA